MEITFATHGLVSITIMGLWLSSIATLATLSPVTTNISPANMESGFHHIKYTASKQVNNNNPQLPYRCEKVDIKLSNRREETGFLLY